MCVHQPGSNFLSRIKYYVPLQPGVCSVEPQLTRSGRTPTHAILSSTQELRTRLSADLVDASTVPSPLSAALQAFDDQQQATCGPRVPMPLSPPHSQV
jgi:hypothetical protein